MKDAVLQDLTATEREQIRASSLANEDLAPVTAMHRTWTMVNIAHLWVGMSVCIPTYMLASGLISQGMNWWQAILTVALGYSALLGPIGGILICDYFVLRRTRLNQAGLYDPNGPYRYARGVNPAALIALVVAILPNVPGFLGKIGALSQVPTFWAELYHYAWFTGFFVAFALYALLMRIMPTAPKAIER